MCSWSYLLRESRRAHIARELPEQRRETSILDEFEDDVEVVVRTDRIEVLHDVGVVQVLEETNFHLKRRQQREGERGREREGERVRVRTGVCV